MSHGLNRFSFLADALIAEWKEVHDDPDEDPPVDVLYDWADRAASLLEEMFGEN